jgi:hypothetical protein
VSQHRGLTPQTGHVNYTIVEEIPTGEEVLVGMFFLNDQHIVILFDFGVSHDFMRFTCVKKAMLILVASETPYMISTPDSRVNADQSERVLICAHSSRASRTTFAK